MAIGFCCISLIPAEFPSALALLGAVAQGAVGMVAFQLGAVLVRSQRESVAATLAALFFVIAALPAGLFLDRLKWVGTFAQFDRNFGLQPYAESAVLQGSLAMGSLVTLALVVTLLGIRPGSNRGA